ncbi:hypothetical protein LguiB_006774 [Lonicera macranthoides]
MELPQLPVWHVPLPFLSNWQLVRPHIRPLHPSGAVKTADWPGFNVKPSPLDLSFCAIPGQIVSLQLLIMVKFEQVDNFSPAKFDP